MTPKPSKVVVSKWKDRIYWRILRRSPIFRYWYKKTVTEAYYDLELADIKEEQALAMSKWYARMSRNV